MAPGSLETSSLPTKEGAALIELGVRLVEEWVPPLARKFRLLDFIFLSFLGSFFFVCAHASPQSVCRTPAV